MEGLRSFVVVVNDFSKTKKELCYQSASSEFREAVRKIEMG